MGNPRDVSVGDALETTKKRAKNITSGGRICLKRMAGKKDEVVSECKQQVTRLTVEHRRGGGEETRSGLWGEAGGGGFRALALELERGVRMRFRYPKTSRPTTDRRMGVRKNGHKRNTWGGIW